MIRTWSISSAPRPASATGGYVPPMADFEGAVVDRLRSDIAALGLPEGLEVECHAVHGSAGRRLLEVSKGAHMLVLGTRGGGGFRGLGFGSTADQVVRHAVCPVVVVPVSGEDDPTTSTASCVPTSRWASRSSCSAGPSTPTCWRASSPATSVTTTCG